MKKICSLVILVLLLFTVLADAAFDTTFNPKDVSMKLGATTTTVSVSGVQTDYEVWRAWYDGSDDLIKKIYAHLSFTRSVNIPTNYAGTAANDSTVGTIDWTNPSYATGVGDAYSASLVLTVSATSHYLKLTAFGFNIPSSATIRGIKLHLTDTLNSYSLDNSVRLVISNALAGIEKTFGHPTYGGMSDLWLATVTPALINDTNNFGVAISFKNSSSGFSSTNLIDSADMTIYYSVPVSWRWQVRNRIPGSAWVDLHTSVSESWDWNTTTSSKDIIFETAGQHIPFELRLIITKTGNDTVNLTFSSTASTMELIGY